MNYARTKRNFGNVRKYLGNMRKTQVCPVCVAKFRHVGQCASHWTECHVNLMYLEKKRTRKRSRVAATFVERAGQFLDRTPWAKGRVLVCRKCHFATNFLSAMREHLDFNSGRCLLPMWAKFDKDTRDALQKRFKFTVVNDNEGLAQYEEMAKLEIDYEADFDDLAFSSRDNLEKYTGCRLSPTPAVHMESSTSLPQTNCPGVHKDFLFFDVALHKRRSGLHGLRRNTSATLCSKCFQVFLEVSAFENHFCLGVKNEEGNLSNATAVAVRNESNWPPDLGNGYRKPLCFADPHEKFERSILCTSCNTACYSFSKLHQHMIECGNSRFNPRSDGTIPAKLTGPSSLEDHSSMEVNSKGSNRSTQKGNSGSKSAPTTPVRQHKYNMREMARNRRNRFSQSP